MYRLVVDDVHTFDLNKDVVLVGRRAGVDVQLPHAMVGGVQLRLERQPGGKVVAVEDGRRRELTDGDVIEVGPFKLRYVAKSEAAAATGEPETAALARAMVRDLLAAMEPHGEGPVVEIGRTRRVPLPAPGKSLVIGRGENCDVVVEDVDLSREHVRVNREWGGVTVSDLGSKNGTRVEGVRVEVGVERAWRDGEKVEIGGTVLVLRDPAEKYLREIAEEPVAASASASASAPAPASAPASAAASASVAVSAPASAPASASVAASASASVAASASVPVAAPVAAPRRWGTMVVGGVVVVGAIAAIVALLSS